MTTAPQRLIGGIDSFPLLAVPLLHPGRGGR